MKKLFFPAAIWLDNVPLTDQGRSPVEVSREEKFIENELANASKRRYFQATKESWNLQWTFLPDNDQDTFDECAGRLTLRELIGNRGEVHVLKFYNSTWAYQEYDVFVENYSEILTRRDPVSNTFFWDVTLALVEV